MAKKGKKQSKKANKTQTNGEKTKELSSTSAKEAKTDNSENTNALLGLCMSSKKINKVKTTKTNIDPVNIRKYTRSRKCKFTGTYDYKRHVQTKNENPDEMRPDECITKLELSDYNDPVANRFFQALGIRRIKFQFTDLENVA